MSRRLLVPLLAGALLVGAAACSGDDADDASDTTAATTRDLRPLSAIEVELDEPGQEPRTALVQSVNEGATWDGGIEFELAAEGLLAARALGDTTMGVVEIDDDGNALVHYTLDGLDVALSDTVSSAGNTTPDALDVASDVLIRPDRAGVAATTPEVAASGAVPGAEGIADSLDPRLVFLLFPFPSEPVGQGARWTIRGEMALLGSPVQLVGDVHLVRLQGNAFTIETAITISPGPSVEGAVELDLTGVGRVRGDLHQLGPRTSTMAVSGTGQIPDRPEPQPVSLRLDLEQRHAAAGGE